MTDLQRKRVPHFCIMQKPLFSVLIPVYNRREEIEALLDSLEKQTLSKDLFEVVIIDDGSTDGTAEWIKDLQSALNISYLLQPRRGPGAARNRGMENAKGEIFVFIDSDCTAPPEWLDSIKKAFQSDPDIMAYGGRDDAKIEFPPLLKAINHTMTSFLFTGGMRGGKKKRLAKFYPRSFNMGIRCELYKKIDGFGKLRHGQDIEFSNRIIRSGVKVAYIPEAVVYHRRRTSPWKFFKQVFNWGVARINLYKIDSAMLEPLHFMPAFGFWFVLIFTMMALFFTPLFAMWKILALLAVIIVTASSLEASIKWKSLTTGLYVPLVVFLQISGYALGFSSALLWRVILNKSEFTGFVKRYYK